MISLHPYFLLSICIVSGINATSCTGLIPRSDTNASYNEYQTYVLPKKMAAALREGLKATTFSKHKRKAILKYITKEKHKPSRVSFLSSEEYAQVEEMRTLFRKAQETKLLSSSVTTMHLLTDCTRVLKKRGMKETLMAILECIYRSKAIGEGTK